MDEEKIREIMDQVDPEHKIPEETLQELIFAIRQMKEHPLKSGDEINFIDEEGKKRKAIFQTLQEKMGEETDWRKKASIAAKIISLDME